MKSVSNFYLLYRADMRRRAGAKASPFFIFFLFKEVLCTLSLQALTAVELLHRKKKLTKANQWMSNFI